jgi:hypothetical protein
MPKHSLEEEDATERSLKRQRSGKSGPDRLSRLSDELLLRILSYLSVDELNTCQE